MIKIQFLILPFNCSTLLRMVWIMRNSLNKYGLCLLLFALTPFSSMWSTDVYCKSETSSINGRMISALKKDSIIFNNLAAKFNSQGFLEQPVGHQVIEVARSFLGKPYIAGTLESEEKEHLVVNLREMDCVTFVENVLALTFTFNHPSTSIEQFYDELVAFRYRGGKIDGYLSRLHYFTDWMQDNSQRGRLKIVSNEFGEETITGPVNFMSQNPHLYRQLNDNPILLKSLREIENRVSAYSLKYIPKHRFLEFESYLKEGDIIAFVTSIKGLDVSHVGFATRVNGELYLLHASTISLEVEISPENLNRYLDANRRVRGVLVGRVNSSTSSNYFPVN